MEIANKIVSLFIVFRRGGWRCLMRLSTVQCFVCWQIMCDSQWFACFTSYFPSGLHDVACFIANHNTPKNHLQTLTRHNYCYKTFNNRFNACFFFLPFLFNSFDVSESNKNIADNKPEQRKKLIHKFYDYFKRQKAANFKTIVIIWWWIHCQEFCWLHMWLLVFIKLTLFFLQREKNGLYVNCIKYSERARNCELLKIWRRDAIICYECKCNWNYSSVCVYVVSRGSFSFHCPFFSRSDTANFVSFIHMLCVCSQCHEQ